MDTTIEKMVSTYKSQRGNKPKSVSEFQSPQAKFVGISNIQKAMVITFAVGVTFLFTPNSTVNASKLPRVIEKTSNTSSTSKYSLHQVEHTHSNKSVFKEADVVMPKFSKQIKANVINKGFQKNHIVFDNDDFFEEEQPLLKPKNIKTVQGKAKVQNQGYKKNILNFWEDEE